MKKNLFLTTVLLVGLIAPAFADDVVPNTDKKITGGAGTCTVDVLGVSDNNATANTIATWSLNSYECAAGQYLDETTLNCTECPIGSYCPGGVFTVEANNSKNTCPADYTSDTAATAESECYMGCELACTQQTCPEYSENCTHGVSSTTGKQYVDATCNAEKTFCSIDFECAPGYYKIIANSEFIIQGESITVSGGLKHVSCNLNNEDEGSFIALAGGNSCDIVTPGIAITINTPEIESDNSLLAALYPRYYIKWQISYNNNDINNNDVIRKSYKNADGDTKTFAYSYDANFTTEITGNNVWVKPVSIFLLTPNARAIADLFSNSTPYSETNIAWRQLRASVSDLEFESIKKFLTDDFQNLSTDGAWALFFSSSTVEVQTNYPWIYLGETQNKDFSNEFALSLMGSQTNSYLFDTTDPTKNPLTLFLPNNGATYCMNNSININWNPDNGTDASQSMCMYGDGLATPDDPVRPGYTFTGWKLIESTTTE